MRTKKSGSSGRNENEINEVGAHEIEAEEVEGGESAKGIRTKDRGRNKGNGEKNLKKWKRGRKGM